MERPLTGIVAAIDTRTLQTGKYFEYAMEGLDIKINKWGMIWPIGILGSEVVEAYVTESQHRSLREIIGRHIVNEGKDLWEQLKNDESDLISNDRSVVDIAINEGYVKAGLEIQYAILQKEVQDSLIIDPSGLDLLNQHLEEEAELWNEISQFDRDPDMPEDAQVMGYRQAVERYEHLYHYLVNRGASPDEGSNGIKQLLVKTKRDANRYISKTALHVGSIISNRISKFAK